MVHKNEIFVGLGNYNPRIFYMHINLNLLDYDDTFNSELYEYVSKTYEQPIIYIFDVKCDILADEVVSRGYNLICITKDYEMTPPSDEMVEQAIKEILHYKNFNDNIFYIINKQKFKSNQDNDIREVGLLLLRSLGKHLNYRTVYI